MPKEKYPCPPLSEVDVFNHMAELHSLPLALDGPACRFIKTFEPNKERRKPLARMAADYIAYFNLRRREK